MSLFKKLKKIGRKLEKITFSPITTIIDALGIKKALGKLNVDIADFKRWIDRIELPHGDEINLTYSDEPTYIGYGIDLVKGKQICSSQLKARIFEPKDEEILFTKNTSEDISFQSSYSLDSISKEVNAALGVHVNMIAFKSDITGSFGETVQESEETCFTYFNYNLIKGLESIDNCSISGIKEMLTENFKLDINNPNVSPAELVNCYGTHVLANSIVHGARCSFYVISHNTKKASSSTVKGEIKTKIFGQKIYSESTQTEEHQELIKNTSCNFRQWGGLADNSATATIAPESALNVFYDWRNSLSKKGMAEEISKVGMLHGIWDLADEPTRKQDILNYINDLRGYKYTPSLFEGTKIFKTFLVQLPNDFRYTNLPNDILMAEIRASLSYVFGQHNFMVECCDKSIKDKDCVLGKSITYVVSVPLSDSLKFYPKVEVINGGNLDYCKGHLTIQRLEK